MRGIGGKITVSREVLKNYLNLRRINVALWPPKPREFDKQALTFTCLALLGT